MLRTTLAGLRAHKLRLLLSALAIVLGVGFVAGTLTFSDTIRSAFFTQFARSAQNVDVSVQPVTPTTPTKADAVPTLPASLLARLRGLPGVASVEGRMSGPATLLSATGRPITNGDTGGLAMDVPADARFQAFTLTAGRLPAGPAEALLDQDTAATRHFTVGGTATVLDATGARHTVRLVGLADIGVAKDVNGTSVLEMTPAGLTALGITGYQRIDLAAASGVSQESLAASVGSAIGPGYQVRTGAALAHDLADSVLHSVDLITTGILVFAIIAMFVAAIVIFNTFNILVAQRLRELALLRCVGASAGQVFGGVLVESFVVGLVASAAGVLAGLGITEGMRLLFGAFGAGIPSGGLVVTVQSILIALLVGTVVTVLSAILPAARATRVAPIAALRAPTTVRVGQVRHALPTIAIAAVFGVVGIVIAWLGLNRGRDGLLLEVGGGIAFFLGVLVAGPLLVGPLSRLLGWLPGRFLGVPTRLAVANARRNPGRSAATMIALTIGVGLITVVTVVTTTAHDYAFAQIDEHYPADYVLRPLHSGSSDNGSTLPVSVADGLRAQPQIAEAAEMRDGNASTGGQSLGVVAVDPSAYGVSWRPQLSAGSIDSLASGTGGIALLDSTARALRATVGDTVRITLGGTIRTMRLVAILTSRFGGEDAVVSWPDFTAAYGSGGDDIVLVVVRSGTSLADGQAAIDRATAADPLVSVQSIAAYKDQVASSVNTILAMFAGLLAIAIVIALFGIANTLSLSVIERTRESGLLRALGLTRGQLRRTLSVEALLIGVMGGLIGVVIGVGFGWSVGETFVRGAGGQGSVTYPVAQIIGYVVLAALAGLAAGVLPARRAARVSVIEAIVES